MLQRTGYSGIYVKTQEYSNIPTYTTQQNLVTFASFDEYSRGTPEFVKDFRHKRSLRLGILKARLSCVFVDRLYCFIHSTIRIV